MRGGIDAGFEKLVQDGAIRIEVHDFVGATDRESKETWALDFFKDHLLAQYFTPSLTVGELRGGMPQTEGLDAVLQRAEAMRRRPTPAPARPTDDEPVRAPGPAREPRGQPHRRHRPGRRARPTASPTRPRRRRRAADSPTAHTGHAAAAADAAALGSSAAAGVATAVTAARPPGAAGRRRGAAGPPPAAQPRRSRRRRGEAAPTSGRVLPHARDPAGGAQDPRPALQPQRGHAAHLRAAGVLRPAGRRPRPRQPLHRGRSRRPVLPRDDDPASTVPDMAAIGLRAVEVALSYGTPTDPGGVKTRDMRFEGQNAPEQTWTVFQNDGDEQRYRYTVQYPLRRGVGLRRLGAQLRVRAVRDHRPHPRAQPARAPRLPDRQRRGQQGGLGPDRAHRRRARRRRPQSHRDADRSGQGGDLEAAPRRSGAARRSPTRRPS